MPAAATAPGRSTAARSAPRTTASPPAARAAAARGAATPLAPSARQPIATKPAISDKRQQRRDHPSQPRRRRSERVVNSHDMSSQPKRAMNQALIWPLRIATQLSARLGEPPHDAARSAPPERRRRSPAARAHEPAATRRATSIAIAPLAVKPASASADDREQRRRDQRPDRRLRRDQECPVDAGGQRAARPGSRASPARTSSRARLRRGYAGTAIVNACGSDEACTPGTYIGEICAGTARNWPGAITLTRYAYS